MTHMNVSIDSLEPAMFQRITGHNRLDEVLRGIDAAFAAGLPRIKVNTVLMKGLNDKELDRFLDWIKDQPITVRLIELMETGDSPDFFQTSSFVWQGYSGTIAGKGLAADNSPG